ncbi:hypothetical protein D3C84_1038510 [compost metagenome]
MPQSNGMLDASSAPQDFRPELDAIKKMTDHARRVVRQPEYKRIVFKLGRQPTERDVVVSSIGHDVLHVALNDQPARSTPVERSQKT